MEITTTNLEEIRSIAEEKLSKADEAENVAEQKKLNEELDEVINHYTAVSKKLCYESCKASEDPLKTAILKFSFPSIKVKEEKDKDTGIVTRRIIDVEKPIDIGDLHKKLGGVGADPKWLAMAENFNFHLTLRTAQRMNVTIDSDAYKLSDLARQIDLGKNPCSNTKLLATLQAIVTAMLGEEYKATSHDVNYLCDCYASDNKKSKTSITAANHKTLRAYLKKVCYRILTGGTGYDVETREIKN